MKFQVKDGYSIADGLKAADNSIGVISEAVATPTKESLKDVEKLTSNDMLINEPQSKVLLRKSIKNVQIVNALNRDSLEYIDKSEVDDAMLAIRELTEGHIEGGAMIASVEDVKDIDLDVDEEDMKIMRRMKKILYVSDLSTKLNDPRKTKSVYQKSQLYLGVLFLVSIYYSLPVLQMVFRYAISISIRLSLDHFAALRNQSKNNTALHILHSRSIWFRQCSNSAKACGVLSHMLVNTQTLSMSCTYTHYI